jgi:hypothetical protein
VRSMAGQYENAIVLGKLALSKDDRLRADDAGPWRLPTTSWASASWRRRSSASRSPSMPDSAEAYLDAGLLIALGQGGSDRGDRGVQARRAELDAEPRGSPGTTWRRCTCYAKNYEQALFAAQRALDGAAGAGPARRRSSTYGSALRGVRRFVEADTASTSGCWGAEPQTTATRYFNLGVLLPGRAGSSPALTRSASACAAIQYLSALPGPRGGARRPRRRRRGLHQGGQGSAIEREQRRQKKKPSPSPEGAP